MRVSMDGKGAWRDNIFVERLWKTVKYEDILRLTAQPCHVTVDNPASDRWQPCHPNRTNPATSAAGLEAM